MQAMVKRFFAWLIKYRSLYIISLLTLLCVELLNHPSLNLIEYGAWILTHLQMMIMNYILYLNIAVVLFLIIRRMSIANMILSVVMIVIGICNYFKLCMKGENVVLWDALNLQAATDVMSELSFDITWQIILTVAIGLGIVIWQIIDFRKETWVKPKFRYLVVALVIFSTMTIGVVSNNNVLKGLNITNSDWNQDKNYRENGFLLCFFMNLKNMMVVEPANYSAKTLEEINRRIDAIETPEPVDVDHPNIIVVMDESFADITIANDGLSFDEPLTPFIDSLNDNVLKGNLLVSIFGGGTANTEFEFLTGHSMAHLPEGSVAYDHYIDDHCDSMVQTLKDEGYDTLAIHPYLETFWSRDEVYPLMGFNDFISEDDFAKDAKRIKGYVSDEAVYEQIVASYEQQNSTSANPLFTFVVTMENHTPYSDTSNGTVGIQGDDKLFNAEGKEEASIHARGVQDADAMYQKLVTYFSTVDEPTIVVMFGDHHPFISSIINNDADHLDEVNKYKTPFAIWANYEIETQTDMTVSSSALGAYTLLNAGIDLPNYFKYNYYASTLLAGYNSYFILGKDGTFYTWQDELPADIQQFLDDHEILQYDLMFGEGYDRDYLWQQAAPS